MTLKVSQLQFAGSLGGLANYDTASFHFTVNAQTLAVGNVSEWTTVWAMDNTNSISGVQINYAGLETVWRYCGGAVVVNFDSGNYQLETLTYYLGNLFHVETYVINQTGGSLSIPQFDVNVRLFLYNAPF
jgi:hypothetical protein